MKDELNHCDVGNRVNGRRGNHLLFTRHVLYCSLMTFSSTSSSAATPREGRISSQRGRQGPKCCEAHRWLLRNSTTMCRNGACGACGLGALLGARLEAEGGTARTRSSISRGSRTGKCQWHSGSRSSTGTKIRAERASSSHPCSAGDVWRLCQRVGGPRRLNVPESAKVYTEAEACHIPFQTVAPTSPLPG
jgi:hypothetical protein